MAPPRGPKQPLPPQDLPAEEYVLGSLMLGNTYALEVIPEILTPSDFYRESHARIYEACLELFGNGIEVDALTVAAKLEEKGIIKDVGGRDRIRELATLVPATTAAPHHARLVRDAATRRGLTVTGEAITRLGMAGEGEPAEMLSTAERLVFDLSQSHGRSRGDLTPAREIAREAYQLMEELHTSGRQIIGLPTGFGVLDGLTYGLKPGSLNIIAGRPSMGKSGLALGIVAHNVLHVDPPVPVALFSLEMSKIEVMQRLVSMESLVDSTLIQNPWKLGSADYRAATGAFARLGDAPLFIDETGASTMIDIRSKARRLKLRQPDLALVVVDYVQLMTAGVRADNRNAELSMISRSMKLLATELAIPVLILSQLSRQVEDRHDKRPIMSDLRESGALEQDADLIAMVYREEYYFPEEIEVQGIAEVNVVKQRNGPVGMRKLAFRSRYAKFTDLAPEPKGETQ